MLQFEIQLTDRGATVFVHGAVSIAGVWEVLHACENLPAYIRWLRIDLAGVRLVQQGVVETVVTSLRHWRETRSGMTRVDLPANGLANVIIGGPRFPLNGRDTSVAQPYEFRDGPR